jgi:hypothetical protein
MDYTTAQLIQMALTNEDIDESGDASLTSFFEDLKAGVRLEGLTENCIRSITQAYLEWALGPDWRTSDRDDAVAVRDSAAGEA